MNLETKRLFLKETDWDDLPAIHSMLCEPEVEQYNTIGRPGNLEVTKAIIAGPIEDRYNRRRSMYEWTIRSIKEGHTMGVVGLSLGAERFRSGEIHYSLFPDCWGNGYAYEALMETLKFSFKIEKLHRVYAGVAVNNDRSIKLLEKLGMQREGRGRAVLPIQGEWVDNYRYAILEDEF
ncbi:MAG: GNAT family N-acetyltransferase [Saprospiraceae bacterium]|nr:GNAT family N-acetyltransferase [Saprospiraceae bacterium]